MCRLKDTQYSTNNIDVVHLKQTQWHYTQKVDGSLPVSMVWIHWQVFQSNIRINLFPLGWNSDPGWMTVTSSCESGT